MIRPEVRTQIATPYGPARFPLNRHSQLVWALLLPGHVFMQSGVGSPLQSPLKFRDGKGESGTNVCHALKSMPPGGRVKALGSYSIDGQIVHIGDMTNTTNIWPQREVYRADLEEYLDRTGKTQAQFCDEVTAFLVKDGRSRDSLSLSHLRNCLYRKDKYLSFEVLRGSAYVFKKSVMNYIDDPVAPIAGLDMSNDTEEDRFFAKMLIKGARQKDLTGEQKQFVIEDLFRTVARIHALATPGMGQPREDPSRVQPDLHPDLPSPGPRRTPRVKK